MTSLRAELGQSTADANSNPADGTATTGRIRLRE